jgi:hypothetical protein
MESLKKATTQIIKPPRYTYNEMFDLPIETCSMEGITYRRKDFELFSFNEKK